MDIFKTYFGLFPLTKTKFHNLLPSTTKNLHCPYGYTRQLPVSVGFVTSGLDCIATATTHSAELNGGQRRNSDSSDQLQSKSSTYSPISFIAEHRHFSLRIKHGRGLQHMWAWRMANQAVPGCIVL